MVFDVVRNSQRMAEDLLQQMLLKKWRKTLLEEGRAAKAQEAANEPFNLPS